MEAAPEQNQRIVHLLVARSEMIGRIEYFCVYHRSVSQHNPKLCPLSSQIAFRSQSVLSSTTKVSSLWPLIKRQSKSWTYTLSHFWYRSSNEHAVPKASPLISAIQLRVTLGMTHFSLHRCLVLFFIIRFFAIIILAGCGCCCRKWFRGSRGIIF